MQYNKFSSNILLSSLAVFLALNSMTATFASDQDNNPSSEETKASRNISSLSASTPSSNVEETENIKAYLEKRVNESEIKDILDTLMAQGNFSQVADMLGLSMEEVKKEANKASGKVPGEEAKEEENKTSSSSTDSSMSTSSTQSKVIPEWQKDVAEKMITNGNTGPLLGILLDIFKAEMNNSNTPNPGPLGIPSGNPAGHNWLNTQQIQELAAEGNEEEAAAATMDKWAKKLARWAKKNQNPNNS